MTTDRPRGDADDRARPTAPETPEHNAAPRSVAASVTRPPEPKGVEHR